MKKIIINIFILLGLSSCKSINMQLLKWKYSNNKPLTGIFNHKAISNKDLKWKISTENGIVGKIFFNNDSICYKYDRLFYRIIDGNGNIISDSLRSISNENERIDEFKNIDSLKTRYKYEGYKYKVEYHLPINKNFKYGSEEFNKFEEIILIVEHGSFRSSLEDLYIVFVKRKKNGKLIQIKFRLNSEDFYSLSDFIPYSKDKLIIKYRSLTEGESLVIRIGMLDLNNLRRLRKYLKE